MTAEHHHDERLLAEHARSLAGDLDGVLDIEAGLSEVLLQSRHAALTQDVPLDVDAGLASVLPAPDPDRIPGAPPPPAPTTKYAPPRSPNLVEAMLHVNFPAGMAKSESTLTPAVGRMEVRSQPQIAAGTRAVFLAQRLADDDGGDRGRALDRVDLLAAVLDFARHMVREPEFVSAFRRAATFLGRAEPAPGRPLTADGYLREALRLAREATHGMAAGGDSYLSRTADLAYEIAAAPGLDRALAERAARILGAVRIALVRSQFATHLVTHDDQRMALLLDDFTVTDLTSVDLRGADLTAVRWTETGTRWPPGFDLADLRSRSDESPPGSAIYVVRGDSATVSDSVDP
ncbi:hypothetical protein ACIO6U_26570 [Streptomyces sp. NPDC087422]|uniref:hypothetical protein n=1 Tax=Streptomyces sp. NPDC087422 TaxID=3365786 RepID=UPI00380D6F25